MAAGCKEGGYVIIVLATLDNREEVLCERDERSVGLEWGGHQVLKQARRKREVEQL